MLDSWVGSEQRSLLIAGPERPEPAFCCVCLWGLPLRAETQDSKQYSHLSVARSLMWSDGAQFPDLVNRLIDRIGRRRRRRERQERREACCREGEQGGRRRKGLKMHTSEQCDDAAGGDERPLHSTLASPQQSSITCRFRLNFNNDCSTVPHIL